METDVGVGVGVGVGNGVGVSARSKRRWIMASMVALSSSIGTAVAGTGFGEEFCSDALEQATVRASSAKAEEAKKTTLCIFSTPLGITG